MELLAEFRRSLVSVLKVGLRGLTEPGALPKGRRTTMRDVVICWVVSTPNLCLFPRLQLLLSVIYFQLSGNTLVTSPAAQRFVDYLKSAVPIIPACAPARESCVIIPACAAARESCASHSSIYMTQLQMEWGEGPIRAFVTSS